MTKQLPDEMRILENSYLIDASYLNPLTGQLDMIKLLECTLATSDNHSKAVNDYLDQAFIEQDETWVITQYQIAIKKLPQVGDVISITTQLIDVNRFFAVRKFVLRLADQILMVVYIQFVVLNLHTRALAPIDTKRMKATGIICPVSEKVQLNLKFPLDIVLNQVYEVQVNPSDIDHNDHVNNLVYLRWCQAALQALDFKGAEPLSIQVKYGHELYQTDHIAVSTALWPGQPGKVDSFHEIKCLNRDQVACTIQIKWQLTTMREI